MMLSRILFACVFVALFSSGSSLSCRWMDHKFGQFSENSFKLLDMMANNSTNTTEDVAFPDDLYNQTSNASAEHKVAFAVQILKEVSALFEEDDSSSSLEEITVENFLNVVNRQADELQLCVGGHRKTNEMMHLYFKSLAHRIFGQMGYSASAWELVRMQIKDHLIRVDLLMSSVITSS